MTMPSSATAIKATSTAAAAAQSSWSAPVGPPLSLHCRGLERMCVLANVTLMHSSAQPELHAVSPCFCRCLVRTDRDSTSACLQRVAHPSCTAALRPPHTSPLSSPCFTCPVTSDALALLRTTLSSPHHLKHITCFTCPAMSDALATCAPHIQAPTHLTHLVPADRPRPRRAACAVHRRGLLIL